MFYFLIMHDKNYNLLKISILCKKNKAPDSIMLESGAYTLVATSELLQCKYTTFFSSYI